MIIENKLCGQQRHPIRVASGQRPMYRDMKTPRIVLIARDFDILQKPDELNDAPAELLRVRLDEYQLQQIDDQKPPDFLPVLPNDDARYQIAVVCNKQQSPTAILYPDRVQTTGYTQVENGVHLNARLRVRQRQLRFRLARQCQVGIAYQKVDADRSPRSFDLNQSVSNNFLTRSMQRTSPQGKRFVNAMPVIGVPVGGSSIAESMHNHSTLSGPFVISQYSCSNMSRNISSLL